MRTLMAVLLLLSAVGHAVAIDATIDLNTPGALDSLRDRRPEHYAKVQAILALVEARPDRAAIIRWIETRFDASDVELMLWRVSDPPKLRVSFRLDSTRYAADVVPVLQPARAMPAR